MLVVLLSLLSRALSESFCFCTFRVQVVSGFVETVFRAVVTVSDSSGKSGAGVSCNGLREIGGGAFLHAYGLVTATLAASAVVLLPAEAGARLFSESMKNGNRVDTWLYFWYKKAVFAD